MNGHSIVARMVSRGEGRHIRHPSGALMNVRVLSDETGGVYSMMETVLPPGGVVPRHVHEDEDENNYILEGQLTMQIGEVVHVAVPGSYVVAPRGIEQCFRNEGLVDCRFLTTFLPGGAEGFFLEAAELMRRSAPGRPDARVFERLQRKYGLRYL
ncbi:cupin domain-containing protein [Pseudomonas aeruginosa]|uniref:cupin domain-containing protein n=1 Tax=Pseudomonas aeruginosa TaxID=287 RepID=UPI001053C57E|nr:cupin domain-containing protein [Pseudomonas aeruginosa]HCE6896738.1 cupin domain-containing protein [Pseudomonas aeruginosa]HCE6902402.1 cupin domain-containing protein [Pseudomonas aeruginosa]HCE7019488.1 cupin domain-containing protein [Pseudomonas aeruginosa]HCE7063354.1 cupin domain-containing protein [Pseudomonas aeruginosa]HCE7347057.1 cupin domain-containing protein [Pseudomonas aeruginosa]